MAVINVLPSDGKVIDEGPVGCSVDVYCDDFRHLDIGLPPESLRLKDAGYLTQAVAACDRLLEQNPDPSLAACVRAERYRMLETPLHFSVSRDRAIAMIREEWPEFTEDQFAVFNGLECDRRHIIYAKYAHERINAFENEVVDFFNQTFYSCSLA